MLERFWRICGKQQPRRLTYSIFQHSRGVSRGRLPLGIARNITPYLCVSPALRKSHLVWLPAFRPVMSSLRSLHA